MNRPGGRPVDLSSTDIGALLDGRKTQLRLVLNPQPGKNVVRVRGPYKFEARIDGDDATGCCVWSSNAPCKAGDRLWVRERFWPWTGSASRKTIVYAADGEWIDHGSGWRGKPGGEFLGKPERTRAMARWASRYTLHVEAVKVERLQALSDADAIAHGARSHRAVAGDARLGRQKVWNFGTAPDGKEFGFGLSPRDAFETYWDRLHRAGAWASNPWVAVVSFRAVAGNIDAPERKAA